MNCLAFAGPGRSAALVLIGALCSPVATAAPSQKVLEQTRETLVGLLHGGEREAAVGSIQELEPSATGALLSVLCGDRPMTSDEGPLITGETEGIFFDAMSRWPAERTREEAQRWLRGRVAGDEKLLVLRLLGATGDRDSVPLFLEVLASVRVEERRHPSVSAQVTRSLASLLRRDPSAHDFLASRLRETDALALECMARAAALVSDPRGLSLLDTLSGRAPDLDLAVLDALAGWRPTYVDCDDHGAALLASRFLDSAEAEARRRAARALGELRDLESVPALIELLEDADPGVARTAHWALVEIVGGRLPAEPAEWRRWLAAEQEWHRASLARLDAALAADPGVATKALREAAGHRLFARQLAERIAPALRDSRAAVAIAACGTLASLRATCTSSELVDALGDARPEVREAAQRALCGLTGERLAKDTAAWREWLQNG